MKLITAFLSSLRENNNREWFELHRDQYKAALDAFTAVVGACLEEVSRSVMSLEGLRPQDCVYRIYRDVRFSPDKTPYKTHFAAFVGPGGRKSESGIYFQISSDGFFMAFGIYDPDSDQLKNLRQELDYNLDDFLKLIESPKFKAFWGEPDGEKLKTNPKGYTPDNPAIQYLKMKQIYFDKKLPAGEFEAKAFAKTLAEGLQLALPVREFLQKATEKKS